MSPRPAAQPETVTDLLVLSVWAVAERVLPPETAAGGSA